MAIRGQKAKYLKQIVSIIITPIFLYLIKLYSYLDQFYSTMKRLKGIKQQTSDDKHNNLIDRKNNTVPKARLQKNISLQTFKFYIGPGNNSSLVRRVLSTRKNWQQVQDNKYLFLNFKWQQTNRGYKYQNCVQSRILRQCLNHMQYHQQLSNKENLLKNLTQYCQSHKMNVFDFVPVTYSLNVLDSNFDQNQNIFLKFFEYNLPESLKKKNRRQWMTFKRRTSLSTSNVHRINYFYCKPELKQVYISENSQYLWLLKPSFSNRGNGIHLFNEIQALEEFMNMYIIGHDPARTLNQNSPQIKNKGFRIRQSNRAVKTTSFIVQKYLERPLLISGRKFDIRIWVLLSQQNKVYYFPQGYIRTSSYTYSTSQSSIKDSNVHLTNNAVQKLNKDYGKYEDSNQLSFKVLQEVVNRAGGNYELLINQIKQIIRYSFLSVKKKINKIEREYCFEIFGYDFMIDNLCKPWLIEVNTNPCLEQSSSLLEQLLPRMLDDAFCLTIDKMFPTTKTNYSYVVHDEKSDENLWELLMDFKK